MVGAKIELKVLFAFSFWWWYYYIGTVSAWTPPLQSSSPPRSTVLEGSSLIQIQGSKTSVDDDSVVKSTTSNPFRIGRERLEQILVQAEEQDRMGKTLSQAFCDSILGLCVASDEWDSTLEILDIMKRQGLAQGRSSYRACLQACFEAGNGRSAKEILSAMDKAGVESEPIDIGLTVAAMCRNNLSEQGWWRKALSLLKHHSSGGPSKAVSSLDDVIPVQAYDAVLECMVEEKQWKEAVRLLRLMENGSIESATSLSSGDKPAGFHPTPALSTYRAVIECCVTTNQAEQAVQVLYSMKGRGITPSTYSCELVISALSKKLQWRRAIQLLEFMEANQIQKTVVTYNTVLSACARAREVGMAKNLLNKMRKEGVRPNEVSFNSVIGACASTARWKDALAVLDQCYREPGVQPNIYIYTNAARACAKGKNTKRALSLLRVVKDKGLTLDSYFYTAVIDACAKGGMWKKALALLDEMQEKGIDPTEVTYSVAISACGNGGQWQKALGLLKLMREKGMSVNLITYNAAITALSKASRLNAKNFAKVEDEGLWSRALLLLGQMKKDGIEPDGFCYSSAISCCGAEGRWEEALKLINVMKKGGPRTRPNKIAYTAAISACGSAGEAERALELFQSMKEEGLSADRVAYNTVFSALRLAGDADKTLELWGEMCGTRSMSSRVAIATAKDSTTPDIITLTNCVATLFRAGRKDELDQVFKEAVERGIILKGNNLDSQWETDLSGMSVPVASTACRYILKQALNLESEHLQDITFITGVGKHHLNRKRKDSKDNNKKDPKTSLRDCIQDLLKQDFDPPLESYIPQRAQGTVVVKKDSLVQWKSRQSN